MDNNFKVFKELTNETNESLYNQLFELSKGNLNRAVEMYFSYLNCEENDPKRKSCEMCLENEEIYLGEFIAEGVSLTCLNKVPINSQMFCRTVTSKPKKKENIDKSIRLTLQEDGLSVAKLNYSLSEKLYPLISSLFLKLQVRTLAELNINTLDNFPVKVSAFITSKFLSDPNQKTSEETNKSQISLDEYCSQRDSFKYLLNLLKIPKTQTALISKDQSTNINASLSEEEKSQCLTNLELSDLKETQPSFSFRSSLLRYQAQALTWMIERERKETTSASQLHYLWDEFTLKSGQKLFVNSCTGQVSIKFPAAEALCKGGILADEMGLGKTVMIIALIHTHKRERLPCKPCKQSKSGKEAGTLVVVPLSLIDQWKQEFDLHGSDLNVVLYYENKERTSAEVRKADVVITTYGVVNSEDSNKRVIQEFSWFRVVLDEAHTIRNRMTETAKSTFKLRAEHKWALTGTPIQNSIDDLFSLVRFLEYQPWNEYVWWNKIITQKFHKKCPESFVILHKLLKPIMLRRTKSSKQENGEPIISLPKLNVQEVRLKLPENDQITYNTLVTSAKKKYSSMIVDFKSRKYVACVFELLLRLRQFCDHPLLLKSRSKIKNPEKIEDFFNKFRNNDNLNYIKELTETIKNGSEIDCPVCLQPVEDTVITKCLHLLCRDCASLQIEKNHNCPLCKRILSQGDLVTFPRESKFSVNLSLKYSESVKISFLLEFLSNRTGKTVVFTQWVSMLDVLEFALQRAQVTYSRVDGVMSRDQRKQGIQDFKTSKQVLIMSLKAGCQGLNLTCADSIVLLDPWWNPAVEKQAVERVHRIGQTRNVTAFKVICEGTVEEQVIKLQRAKEQINAGAFTEETCSLSLENIRNIFESL
jgi:DNA repair protein RAD5